MACCSKTYLPVPEEQKGRQPLHIEAFCQVGLLIYINHCVVYGQSLCELRACSFVPRLFEVLKAGLPRRCEKNKPAAERLSHDPMIKPESYTNVQ